MPACFVQGCCGARRRRRRRRPIGYPDPASVLGRPLIWATIYPGAQVYVNFCVIYN